jgi:vitamin B12 transporter
MRYQPLFASVAVLALSAPALAATENVVVTATRTPQPSKITGVSINVISSEDLKLQQIAIVSDALIQVPGVTIVRNGGIGQTTTLGLRGSPPSQSLTLIDGVRINDPSSVDDQALLGDVLVNNIDRIEVLRGPQSTLYGSEAIGGVVNILTQRGGDTPFALDASAEGGSFDTWHLNAGAHGSAGIVDYGAALNWYDTGGISAADRLAGNIEKDGYRNFGAAGNVRINASDMLSIDLRAYYTDAHSDFDGFPPPFFIFSDTAEYGTNTLFAGYAGVNLSLFDDRFRNRFAFITSDADRHTFDPTSIPLETFFAKGTATRFEYQGIFEVNAANELTFGAESERTHLSTASIFSFGTTTGSKTITGYYAQWQTTLFDSLTLTGGVRLDDDSQFGSHTSVKLAAAWQVGDTTTLRANYGDGFKAPSLYQLFSEFSKPIGTLKPETARGWEAGVDQFFLNGNARASLTWFERHTRNQIDFFSCFFVVSPECTLRGAVGGYYDNLDRSRSTGLETEVEVSLPDGLSATVNYSYLEPVNQISGLDLARRPRNSANAIVTWSSGVWTAGASLTYVGPRWNDDFAFTRLSSNTTANLFASYQLTEQFQLFARVENVFDETSEPAGGYGRMPRAYTVGLRAAL